MWDQRTYKLYDLEGVRKKQQWLHWVNKELINEENTDIAENLSMSVLCSQGRW